VRASFVSSGRLATGRVKASTSNTAIAATAALRFGGSSTVPAADERDLAAGDKRWPPRRIY
jgi:hypothetical protein